jgi:molecular chaperone GrpE (heat shock protein)
MNAERISSDVFEIDDEPIPTTGVVADCLGSPLTLIENDIRRLMHRLAVAEHEKDQLEKAMRDEVKSILLALIDILDAFERVFEAVGSKQDLINRQMKKWIGNFRTIRRLLENLLYEEGVRAIENLDDGFDPKWHRAVDTISDPGKPDGTIVEQVQKGYFWHNAMLRKAEVIVVQNDNGVT